MRDDSEGKQKLSKLLLISFDVLDTYGKEPEQLANINLAFQIYLEDYAYWQIEAAFKQYMRSNRVIPKPVDIIEIMDYAKPKTAGLTEGQREKLMKFREEVNNDGS